MNIKTTYTKFLNERNINEARASAVGLLKDVVKGSTSSVEGIKLSKDMAQAYLDWISGSTYGKKFGALPWNKLFDASFNWGIERYAKGKLKGELKELKAKAKEMSESVNEELSPEIYSAIATVKTEKDGPERNKAMATILNAAKANTLNVGIISRKLPDLCVNTKTKTDRTSTPMVSRYILGSCPNACCLPDTSDDIQFC